MQLGLADIQAVFFRQQLRDAQRAAAGNDRHLVQPIDAGHDPGQQRVCPPRDSRSFSFSLPLSTSSRLGPIRILSRAYSKSSMSTLSLPLRVAHRAASLTRLRMSAPVRPTVPAARRSKLTSSAERHVAGVDLEDRDAALLVRPVDCDVPIEAAGPQQRRIEHVGAVGGGQHDDGFGLA